MGSPTFKRKGVNVPVGASPRRPQMVSVEGGRKPRSRTSKFFGALAREGRAVARGTVREARKKRTKRVVRSVFSEKPRRRRRTTTRRKRTTAPRRRRARRVTTTRWF